MKKIIALLLVMLLSIFGISKIIASSNVSLDPNDVTKVEIEDPNPTPGTI